MREGGGCGGPNAGVGSDRRSGPSLHGGGEYEAEEDFSIENVYDSCR